MGKLEAAMPMHKRRTRYTGSTQEAHRHLARGRARGKAMYWEKLVIGQGVQVAVVLPRP